MYKKLQIFKKYFIFWNEHRDCVIHSNSLFPPATEIVWLLYWLFINLKSILFKLSKMLQDLSGQTDYKKVIIQPFKC